MNAERQTCVVINSYNYEDYVVEAVSSALNQEGVDPRVVVIDDGSTDRSVALLRDRFGSSIKIIEKPNAGQLSCFNEIPHLCQDEEIVFFLDADDYYEAGYLKAILDIYSQRPHLEFVFSDPRLVGDSESGYMNGKLPSGDQGFSVISSLIGRRWIGSPTSCLSICAPLLRKFLPYRQESDWKTRADDVLVFGASALGARKYHAPVRSVCYRQHAENHFANRTPGFGDGFSRELKLVRLFRHLEQCSGQIQQSTTVLMLEFQSLPSRTSRHFWQYVGYLSRMRAPLGAKAHALGSLVKTVLGFQRS